MAFKINFQQIGWFHFRVIVQKIRRDQGLEKFKEQHSYSVDWRKGNILSVLVACRYLVCHNFFCSFSRLQVELNADNQSDIWWSEFSHPSESCLFNSIHTIMWFHLFCLWYRDVTYISTKDNFTGSAWETVCIKFQSVTVNKYFSCNRFIPLRLKFTSPKEGLRHKAFSLFRDKELLKGTEAFPPRGGH